MKYATFVILLLFAVAVHAQDLHSNYATKKAITLKGGIQPAGTLAAAIAPNTTISLPSNYSETIKSSINVSVSNVTIQCSSGATIKAGPGVGKILAFTGSNYNLSGCTLDGQGNGRSGDVLVWFSGVSNANISGNILKNTVPSQYGIRIDDGDGFSIKGNNITSNIQGSAITLLHSGSHISIIDNILDNSAAPISDANVVTTVEFKDSSGGTYGGMQNITITGNKATNSVGFCYEGGDWAKESRTHDIIVTWNTCQIKSTTGTTGCGTPSSTSCGGISISGQYNAGNTPPQTVTNVTVANNTINEAGQRVSIAAIEIVNCSGCSITGNTINGPGDSDTLNDSGITLNKTQHATVSANSISGFGSHSPYVVGGVIVYSQGQNADGNTISGNKIYMPKNRALPDRAVGIYVACNGAGGSAQNERITGNLVIGQGAGQGAIVGYGNSDCPASAIISGNNFENIPVGVFYARYFTVYPGSNTFTKVKTTFSDNGGTNARRLP
jgi:hypothetical protein